MEQYPNIGQKGDVQNETDLSAKEKTEKQGAWIPEKNEHQGRQTCTEEKKTEGQEKAHSVRPLFGGLFYHQTLSGGKWLDKKHRLRKNRDFQYTYKKGRSLGHPLLVMVFRKTRRPETRVGFSINRKFGKAVERNRIKRQLRVIAGSRIHQIKQGFDIIFVVRRKAKEASYQDLDIAVYHLLKRGRLLGGREE